MTMPPYTDDTIDLAQLGTCLLNALGASRAAGHVSILGLGDYVPEDVESPEVRLIRDLVREAGFLGDKDATARLNAFLASSDTMRRGAEAAGRVG